MKKRSRSPNSPQIDQNGYGGLNIRIVDTVGAIADPKITSRTEPRLSLFLARWNCGRKATAANTPFRCAGLNRHEAEDESSLQERSSDPLGLESGAATARDP